MLRDGGCAPEPSVLGMRAARRRPANAAGGRLGGKRGARGQAWRNAEILSNAACMLVVGRWRPRVGRCSRDAGAAHGAACPRRSWGRYQGDPARHELGCK